jgi:glycosyltransferase involved in cell wall biosynthesis
MRRVHSNSVQHPAQVFLVSVVIPVFNAERYLKEAVESVVNLPEVGEVIMIDDASTDTSLAICHQLEKQHPKVRLIHHVDGKNQGVAASRNLGISQARFNYIAFLDADDYYLPNRFKKDKELFLENPGIDGVYGCNQAVFENEHVRKKFLERYKGERTTVHKDIPPHVLYKTLLFGGFGRFHTTAVTLHKRAFQKAGGLFNTALRHGEDTELWLRLSLKATLVAGNIDSPIAVRRVHDNNSIHQVHQVIHYRQQMYQLLFDWVVQQQFRFEVKNSFFICLHRAVKGDDGNIKQLFWEQVSRRPRLIFSPFFFKKVHQLYFIR